MTDMALAKCFEDRLLRRERSDMLKARKSLETAGRKLAEAGSLAQAGFESAAMVTAYASMFHAGRALLFRDGIVEKSHYCLVQYLRKEYAKTGRLQNELITMMDAYRSERHDVMYSLEGVRVKPNDVSAAISTAKKLVEEVKRLLA